MDASGSRFLILRLNQKSNCTLSQKCLIFPCTKKILPVILRYVVHARAQNIPHREPWPAMFVCSMCDIKHWKNINYTTINVQSTPFYLDPMTTQISQARGNWSISYLAWKVTASQLCLHMTGNLACLHYPKSFSSVAMRPILIRFLSRRFLVKHFHVMFSY